MSLDRLRRAIRTNRISFPSQVPVFLHQSKPDVQWRLVALFFIHNWSSTKLGPRYGLCVGYVRELISRWVRRAAACGYLQEIPPELPAMPRDAPLERVRVDPAARNRGSGRSAPLQTLRLCRLSLGRVVIDGKSRSISAGETKVELTPNEWAVLAKLGSKANLTVPRSELIKVLVGARLDSRGAVRHFIESLRRKLEPDSAHPRYLITERTIGYRLQVCEQPIKRQNTQGRGGNCTEHL